MCNLSSVALNMPINILSTDTCSSSSLNRTYTDVRILVDLSLTSLAVSPSVTRGRGRMQQMVTPSLSRHKYSETDGHSGVVTVELRGVSRKLTIRGGVSISHAPCLHCHADLIDTTSCSNRCMLMLYCLITNSIVISRRPTMRITGTGNWQAAPYTYRFWNRNLGRIVPPGRL